MITKQDDKLTAFLYLLLRNEIAFGKLEGILEEIEAGEAKNGPDCFVLSEKNVTRYARTLRDRLVGGER